ncbi:MAG: hypothetical protein AAF652_13165 [Cyanobacteria bacterium P01_C01_bin.72]
MPEIVQDSCLSYMQQWFRQLGVFLILAIANNEIMGFSGFNIGKK